MHLPQLWRPLVLALHAAAPALAQVFNTYPTFNALAGNADSTDAALLGNYYNHWKLTGTNATTNTTTWDLTRSARMATTSPKEIPMSGKRASAIIEPSRSAFVIIDMQNFFLHPKLTPSATLGRAAVGPTVNLIHAFRDSGVKILWTNWGFDDYDLVISPPADLDGFSDDHTRATSFCSDMGTIEGDNGETVQVGKKLCRGSWNARPYGDLDDEMVRGVEQGTDFYFNKNRVSGLWGAQTPLGLYLQENGITTLFFGGVNSDQCVWGALLDAYYKGFDVVYVPDCAATISPWYAEQMVRYNADLNGFIANSSDIIAALKG
ncbi:isochorismatase hydrolase [Colletotrichum navitas]|uniref:Isochorismatase hydrolase n=1 Tax=Colletotrichum navitas TaxID=681940 RepID=A0AAD8V3K9_9PEZI|nr:isochorismatase hydrolase [Colletotrichum navitas]KAK1585998.1 isochorismatase hydrolase [Colletotrichum navitas]